MLQGKDIISIDDFSKEDIESVLKLAKTYDTKGFSKDALEGKMMASLFFEASTRTRLSFETAMQRLSGGVVGFSAGSEGTSYAAKGESFADTIRMVDGYVDVIVIRHPKAGSAAEAAEVAEHPVINAGDGSNEHPTQTMIDLFAIQKTQKKLDGITVAMVGDLKYGRVPHSLAKALSLWNAKQVWIAPDSLKMPDGVKKVVTDQGSEVQETESIEEIIGEVDILYMTRVQSERFEDKAEYEKVKDVYVLSEDILKGARDNMRILHALPRRYEIPEQIDATHYAYYFQQAHGGAAARASVLTHVIGKI
ncbi:aspartate carbamoyltransferase [Patescibacteria group bacterium]